MAGGFMDDTGNGRWLTYSELASVRGINRASAVKLVQRERWQRSTGNERSRVVRVLVPDEWLTRAKESLPDTASVPGMSREDTGMIVALTARAERAEERTDEANKRADVAVALADRTLAQLAEATTRADTARDERDGLQAQLADAQAALSAAQADTEQVEARTAELAAQLDQARAEVQEAAQAASELRQADDARKARGLVARLRDAWRGE
jgi:hypothetical protein